MDNKLMTVMMPEMMSVMDRHVVGTTMATATWKNEVFKNNQPGQQQ